MRTNAGATDKSPVLQAAGTSVPTTRDPVCSMPAPVDSPLSADHSGVHYGARHESVLDSDRITG